MEVAALIPSFLISYIIWDFFLLNCSILGVNRSVHATCHMSFRIDQSHMTLKYGLLWMSSLLQNCVFGAFVKTENISLLYFLMLGVKSNFLTFISLNRIMGFSLFLAHAQPVLKMSNRFSLSHFTLLLLREGSALI